MPTATPPTPRMLRLPEVMRLTGLGRDAIYRLGREGQFPRARKLSAHATAWREDELREWIETRPVSDAASPNPRTAAEQPSAN